MDDAATMPTVRRRDGPGRLLDAAEVLFGRHGVDGVSMRQIQLAAGSGNKFAVQYHFGDTEGLVAAILVRRMPVVDARQAELLRHIPARPRASDVRALLDAMFRPLLEQTNAAGERAYARFVAMLLNAPEGERHYRALLHLSPTSSRILAILKALLPHLPAALLAERLRLLSGMVCTSVFNRVSPLAAADSDARLIDDAIDVAAAGLIAPRRTSA